MVTGCRVVFLPTNASSAPGGSTCGRWCVEACPTKGTHHPKIFLKYLSIILTNTCNIQRHPNEMLSRCSTVSDSGILHCSTASISSSEFDQLISQHVSCARFA
jgi:hypothetical protein